MANQRLKLDIPKSLPSTSKIKPKNDPEVKKYKKIAEDHFDTVVQRTAEDMVVQGKHLRNVQIRQTDEDFWDYVEDNFRYKKGKAYQILRLKEFSRERKGDYALIKHLGFSKVRAMIPLSSRMLQNLVRRGTVKLPGMEKALPLTEISVSLIQQQVNRLQGKNKYNAVRQIRGCGTRIETVMEQIDELGDHLGEFAPHHLDEVEIGLTKALEKVRKLRRKV